MRIGKIIIISLLLLSGIYLTAINLPPSLFKNLVNQNSTDNPVSESVPTPLVASITQTNDNSPKLIIDPTADEKELPSRVILSNPRHTFQSFNNCGPATLSMALGYYGMNVSQQELGQRMRPYQNPQGDNDDKTIFSAEFVAEAERQGLRAISRVNGDIDLLKRLTANDFPVVVKTWLNQGEDIGHFRMVKGYDDSTQVIIQDDSYQGKDLEFSYEDFLSLWQPFNYNYIVVYPSEKHEQLMILLGEESQEQASWANAYNRAKQEIQTQPENVYPWFNLATSAYRLGNYEESVEAYERVASKLPGRMLWYQIEPILAYQKLGRDQLVMDLISQILTNHNRAYTELYLIRGEIYLRQGNQAAAQQEFEQAVRYNRHSEKAKRALESL